MRRTSNALNNALNELSSISDELEFSHLTEEHAKTYQKYLSIALKDFHKSFKDLSHVLNLDKTQLKISASYQTNTNGHSELEWDNFRLDGEYKFSFNHEIDREKLFRLFDLVGENSDKDIQDRLINILESAQELRSDKPIAELEVYLTKDKVLGHFSPKIKIVKELKF